MAPMASTSESGDAGLIEEARARASAALKSGDSIATLGLGAAFVAAVLALLIWAPDVGPEAQVGTLLALVACYAVAARIEFEVGFAIAVPTQLVFVPMLFLAPLSLVPVLVALGFALSALPEYLKGDRHVGRAALSLVSACHALGPVVVILATGSPSPEMGYLPVLAAAVVAQFGFDFASSAARGTALGISPRELVGALGPAWLVDIALTPIGLALAHASLQEPYAFALGLPLMGLLVYFARERKARIDHALELSHAYRGTALLLGDMVEADDAYTGLHSQDVVALVVNVADYLDLDADARRQAELTALLHDVGKVRIPNEIINKAGPLTHAERAVINTHTIEGERMLETVGGLLADVGRLVRSCHERWDGSGYTDGLAGEEIPLVARIVCACDAFSAMTTDRSYRPAMSHEVAIDELQRCAGAQFDPQVVDAIAAISSRQVPARPMARAA
jgi:HD-GYP domain-containing protein (c-di-GMP phosphodiesterase class II)